MTYREARARLEAVIQFMNGRPVWDARDREAVIAVLAEVERLRRHELATMAEPEAEAEEFLSNEAWEELRRLVRDNLESEDDPVPIALAAALLDVDRRLRVIEAQPKRTNIEVVQHFEDVDPDRVANAFIEALTRARKPPA